MPSQIVESTRYWDGGLKTARVAFIARDVPALGYRTFHASPRKARSPATDRERIAVGEAGFGRDDPRERALPRRDRPASGAITSLVYKPADWQVLSGPGNVVSREEDRGDLWEPYKGLDGGSRIAMTNQQPVPDARDRRSTATKARAGRGRC